MSEKELAGTLNAKIADLGSVIEAAIAMFDTLRAAVAQQSDVSPELSAAIESTDAMRAALAAKLAAVEPPIGTLPPAGV